MIHTAKYEVNTTDDVAAIHLWSLPQTGHQYYTKYKGLL